MHQLRRHDSSGQATVEFAFIVPLVIVGALALVGTLTLCLSTLQLNDLSRTIARSAITSDNPSDTANEFAARNNAHVAVMMDEKNGLITVEVKRSHSFPVLGDWLPHLTLRSSTTMMQEPPFVLE